MTKNELYSKMEAIIKRAELENRGMTQAEKARFDQYEAEYRLAGIGAAETRGAPGAGNSDAHAEAFSNYLRYGEITRELRTNPMGTSPGAPGAGGVLAGEGGYLVPQGFWDEMSIALKSFGGLSSEFRQLNTESGNPMPWPAHDPTGNVGSLITENTQVSEVDLSFGQGMLSAWTITSGVNLASVQLVEDSVFDIDQFIAERTGEAIGRKIAALAVNGTGASQPLGVLTAISGRGANVTSGGYVNLTAAQNVDTFAHPTGATELVSNTLNPNSLLTMVSAVDSAYYRCADGSVAKWYMHPQMAWGLRGVVDGNGRSILDFANGLSADNVLSMNYQQGSAVATLLGFEVVLDASLPSALVASTIGPIVFGNLRKAMVQRTVGAPRILRLTERYADYLQVGYIGFVRTDIRSNDMRAVTTCYAQAT
jgi:HK97 family phage major capsid protein